MLLSCLPRVDGNNWKIPKFHDMMHIVDDIEKFGMIKESGTSEGERLMKEVYIKIGRSLSPKSNEKLSKDIMCNISSQYAINMLGIDMFVKNSRERSHIKIPKESQAMFFVNTYKENNSETSDWEYLYQQEYMTSMSQIPKVILSFFEQDHKVEHGWHEVVYSFSLKEMTIRSNPFDTKTRSDFVSFTEILAGRHIQRLGRVVMIYQNCSEENDLLIGWKALIHTSTLQDNNLACVLFTRWTHDYMRCPSNGLWIPRIVSIELSQIHSRVDVIETSNHMLSNVEMDHLDKKSVLEVHGHKEYTKKFLE